MNKVLSMVLRGMVDRPMAIWLKEVGFAFIPLQVLIFNGSKFGFVI